VQLTHTGVLNIIDFVSILPFYVELMAGGEAASGSSAIRVVRLVRVFRVFKISRYLTWVKIFAEALIQSWQPLAMLVFVMGIATVVFSSALYYAERDMLNPKTQQANVVSIPDAFWWCIITMTTVGYGDKVPMTAVGKLIAAVTSLCGILVLAVPITVISTNFNEQYAAVKKRQETIRAKMLLLKNQFKKRR
jgi:voltage-gated potassium channel Kch